MSSVPLLLPVGHGALPQLHSRLGLPVPLFGKRPFYGGLLHQWLFPHFGLKLHVLVHILLKHLLNLIWTTPQTPLLALLPRVVLAECFFRRVYLLQSLRIRFTSRGHVRAPREQGLYKPGTPTCESKHRPRLRKCLAQFRGTT